MAVFDPEKAKDAVKASKATTVAPNSENAATGLPTSLEGRMREDFRYFLVEVWKHLGLPHPTPLQMNFAGFLQHGADRSVNMGFRGLAKTWIAATFGVWNLWNNSQFKVLVVSGTSTHAAAVTNFALGLIRTMPLLKEMQPGGQQRQSTNGFDVRKALPDPTPSFSAAGVTGQLVGKRADLIIPDDVETNTNSSTTAMREKLREQIREFDAILKPGGKIKYLGTPQSQNSIYFELPAEVYTIRIYPARYPGEELQARYGAKLAPIILKKLLSGKARPGQPTEPTRFGEEELYKRELSWGKTGFALQYMLDPSLSDVGRYPLKLKDLIVMSLDHERGPSSVAWGNDERLMHKDIPVPGLDGDGIYKPASISDTTDPYQRKVMFIDPSGRGADELAWAVGSELHARAFVFRFGGYKHGYAPETLQGLADTIIRYNVSLLKIEDNFGDGMFTALLKPIVVKAWEKHNKKLATDKQGGTTFEEVKASRTQKELRVISVLEPALNSHKVVIDTQAIIEDQRSAQAYQEERCLEYSFCYQLTHLTRDKDCLSHDDRLEAVAGLVAHWTQNLGINSEDSEKESREEEYKKMLKALGLEEDEIAGSSPSKPRVGRFQRQTGSRY